MAVVLLAGVVVSLGCQDEGPTTHVQAPAPEHQSSQETISPPEKVQARLRTEPLARHVVPMTVTAPGEVALDPKQTAKVSSRIEGQVDRVFVQLGDRVKEGQALVSIGSLQLDQLIEDYLVASAQADVAKRNFRRTEKLRAEDIVPERKLIEEKGRHIETQARYQHIREKLLNMGLSKGELRDLKRGGHEEAHRYTLTSPIAGTVVTQHAVRGQGVSPGLELFEIVDTSQVWVFANLPIEQVRHFQEGQTGTIIPKGGEPVTAPLTYVAPLADETTRTVQIRFEVRNATAQLKPHEYVDVTLTRPGVPLLAVPETALTAIDRIRGVFREQDTAYRFVPVQTGREGGGWVEVLEGLNEGDRIVVEGAFDLKNIQLKGQIVTEH
ncbi:RND transporter [Nitrospira sp.]|nr:RND transporter [Nitrospira sp.]